MCLVASAEGRRDAWFTVAGGFLGALVYALAFPALKPLLVDRWNLGPVTLGQVLHLSPVVPGVSVGLFLIAIALVLPRTPNARSRSAPRLGAEAAVLGQKG